MTDEKLKQANRLKEEIFSVKSQLFHAENTGLQYVEFSYDSENKKISRNVLDGTGETEMVRELIKNINKAKLERLQKEFNEL